MAMPVIQARPLIVGTTALYEPTRACATSWPVNVVPRIPSCTKSWWNGSSPLACNAAIFAHVPVPHGERSRAPVQDEGRVQSSFPVETTTAFLRCDPGCVGGADN